MIVALEPLEFANNKGLEMDNSHNDKQSADENNVSNSIFSSIAHGLGALQVKYVLKIRKCLGVRYRTN